MMLLMVSSERDSRETCEKARSLVHSRIQFVSPMHFDVRSPMCSRLHAHYVAPTENNVARHVAGYTQIYVAQMNSLRSPLCRRRQIA